MKTTIVCGHKCHDDGGSLNVWVESCPICGCKNEKYIKGAQCCFSCFQYPCACGENNHVNPNDFGNIWGFFGL